MKVIGRYQDRDVCEAVLESSRTRVAIMNYGCVIRDWRVEAGGRAVPCVLGFDTFDPYPDHSKSFSIIAGRVANRTAGGRLTLHGTDYQLPINNGPNHLHGGPEGLGRRLWEMETGTNSVALFYHSPDGEMGYPGAVDFRVVFRLDGTRLTCEMTGRPDRPTPINLAQHNYYNLDGGGDILGHVLEIDAEAYTPVDATQIPTGDFAPVEGTMLDFRRPARIGEVDPLRLGADHNLVLRPGRDVDSPAAILRSDETGLGLTLRTDQPGVQLFTAKPMEIAVEGLAGSAYGPFGGVCLEAQHFPDSLNRPDWPSIIATPDRPYHQWLEMDIS